MQFDLLPAADLETGLDALVDIAVMMSSYPNSPWILTTAYEWPHKNGIIMSKVDFSFIFPLQSIQLLLSSLLCKIHCIHSLLFCMCFVKRDIDLEKSFKVYQSNCVKISPTHKSIDL